MFGMIGCWYPQPLGLLLVYPLSGRSHSLSAGLGNASAIYNVRAGLTGNKDRYQIAGRHK